MSAVEVLAVMEFLVGRYIANKGTDSQFISCITPNVHGDDAALRKSEYGAAWLDLAEARAAVAELIEADKRIAERAHKKAGGGWWMVSNEDMAAMRAALARVGGGK